MEARLWTSSAVAFALFLALGFFVMSMPTSSLDIAAASLQGHGRAGCGHLHRIWEVCRARCDRSHRCGDTRRGTNAVVVRRRRAPVGGCVARRDRADQGRVPPRSPRLLDRVSRKWLLVSKRARSHGDRFLRKLVLDRICCRRCRAPMRIHLGCDHLRMDDRHRLVAPRARRTLRDRRARGTCSASPG